MRMAIKACCPALLRMQHKLVLSILITLGLWGGMGPQIAEAAGTNVSYGYPFFNPKVVQINVGDTVNWTGASGFHTLLGTGSDPICGGATLPCSHTFKSPGQFAYECTIPGHAAAGMTGLVIVASAPLVRPVLTNAVRLSDGEFQFTILSPTPRTNVIEVSDDLRSGTNWTPLATVVLTNGAVTFTDTNAGGFGLRFYRVSE